MQWSLWDSSSRVAAWEVQTLSLGLFIAHAIVIAHGGEIDVTSTAESGTTFEVALPR